MQKQVLNFSEKGAFDEQPTVAMLKSKLEPSAKQVEKKLVHLKMLDPAAETARQKFLLDSGASHMARWLEDDMSPQELQMQEVKLQLAVGEVQGWMHRGGDTVYLDRSQIDKEEFEEMVELLPLERLCRDYELTFVFDGSDGRLEHNITGDHVKVNVVGSMP